MNTGNVGHSCYQCLWLCHFEITLTSLFVTAVLWRHRRRLAEHVELQGFPGPQQQLLPRPHFGCRFVEYLLTGDHSKHSVNIDFAKYRLCGASPVQPRSLVLRLILTYLLTYLLTPLCRIFFEKLIVTQLVKQQPTLLMEPGRSLPCSQKPAIGPYPEPAESISPHRSLSP
jgi:hypothetical protein